jgi:hypothetical protein
MIRAKLKMKLEVGKLMKAIADKRRRVLTKTGAYGRGVQQNKLRPGSRSKKSRTIDVNGVRCHVPPRGKVLDARTQRPVSRELAMAARMALAARHRSEGAGQPPKSGPKKTLRKNIVFVVDDESVVIGARPFPSQPTLIGAASVPHLLDSGGIEIIEALGGSARAVFEPRPFISPSLDPTERKFRQLIESEPL